MTADTAGVDNRPSLPIQIFPTPFAAAMRQMTGIAVSEKYLPSPDTTRVDPATSRTVLADTHGWHAHPLHAPCSRTFQIISRQRVERRLHEILQVMLLLENLDLKVARQYEQP